MAFQLIVDGYNLIGCEDGLKGNLEGKRGLLIQKLQRYHQTKYHLVTVVFDGWRAGWGRQIEERSGGVTIVYSQLGEKADSVIQKLARGIGSGCAVVTSDREVRRNVEASGAVAIFSEDFVAKLGLTDRPDVSDEDEMPPTLPRIPFQGKGKKGNPRKLSKIDRRRREMFKKL